MNVDQALHVWKWPAEHTSIDKAMAAVVLSAEVERLRAQVAAVTALHQRVSYGPFCECGCGCGTGDVDWPCPTARALGVDAPPT